MASIQGGSFNFHFNGMIVVSSGGSISLFATKASSPAEPNAAGMESKNLLMDH